MIEHQSEDVLVIAAGCPHTSGLISNPNPGSSGARTKPSSGTMGFLIIFGQSAS